MIHEISREEFLGLVRRDPPAFLASIEKSDIYVVKRFYAPDFLQGFFNFLRSFTRSQPPSWHPCLDGCPDFHRINDEYPQSYVKAKMHSFYFHRWNSHREIFSPFKEVFEIKNLMGGLPKDSFYDSIPSDGVVCRIQAHQYPKGGGYMNEHVDPVNPFSKIQTLIAASVFGKDFKRGGLFVREGENKEKTMLDSHAELGDLMVLSPFLRHGVEPIDPGEQLDWERADGRWMVTPIIFRSDYNQDPATKPKEM